MEPTSTLDWQQSSKGVLPPRTELSQLCIAAVAPGHISVIESISLTSWLILNLLSWVVNARRGVLLLVVAVLLE